MRRRHPVLLTGASAAGIALLAACAGGGGGSEAPAEVDAASFDGLSLTMWHSTPYDPFMTINEEQLTACADELGMTIDVEAFPSDFLSTVLQAGSSGDLPDILMISSANIGQLAGAGLLSDMGELGFTTDGLAEATAEMGLVDGTLVGVASHVEVSVLEYNPDLLDAAGVEPPTTFDELRDVAAALTTDDVYGITLPGISADGSADFFLMNFILGAGGDPGDLTDPGTVAAIQLYQDLVEDGSMSPEMVNYGWDFQDPYNAGTAAMTVNGPWASAPSEGQAPRAFAPPPATDGNEPASAIVGYEWAIPVTDDSVQAAAAAAVTQCRLAPENQLEIAEAQAYIPADTAAADQWAEQTPDVAPFVALVPNAYSASASFGEDYGTLANQLGSAIQYAVVGGMSAEDALAQAASE